MNAQKIIAQKMRKLLLVAFLMGLAWGDACEDLRELRREIIIANQLAQGLTDISIKYNTGGCFPNKLDLYKTDPQYQQNAVIALNKTLKKKGNLYCVDAKAVGQLQEDYKFREASLKQFCENQKGGIIIW